MFKYTLIVSQYYYSRHYFIVNHTADFIERARKFAVELMQYKRDAGNTKGIYLGDLDPEYSDNKAIRVRYNINDSGDIYFLQSDSINGLAASMCSYQEVSRRESRGFQSKKVITEISEHHDVYRIEEIVSKYFELA